MSQPTSSVACDRRGALIGFNRVYPVLVMMHYIDVAHIEDVEPGTCRSVTVNNHGDVALCNVDGEILALQDTCPHAGGPLGEGTLEGDIVQCPWHGWTFNVRTGQCLKNPVPAWSVNCHRTRVKNGIIQIAVPPES